jgi:hypothetical protein
MCLVAPVLTLDQFSSASSSTNGLPNISQRSVRFSFNFRFDDDLLASGQLVAWIMRT